MSSKVYRSLTFTNKAGYKIDIIACIEHTGQVLTKHYPAKEYKLEILGGYTFCGKCSICEGLEDENNR